MKLDEIVGRAIAPMVPVGNDGEDGTAIYDEAHPEWRQGLDDIGATAINEIVSALRSIGKNQEAAALAKIAREYSF